MAEIKDYDKLYKSLESIRINTLKMLDAFVQDERVEYLRKKIIECNEGAELLEHVTKVLNLQLDYMNEHPELYPKYE